MWKSFSVAVIDVYEYLPSDLPSLWHVRVILIAYLCRAMVSELRNSHPEGRVYRPELEFSAEISCLLSALSRGLVMLRNARQAETPRLALYLHMEVVG